MICRRVHFHRVRQAVGCDNKMVIYRNAIFSQFEDKSSNITICEFLDTVNGIFLSFGDRALNREQYSTIVRHNSLCKHKSALPLTFWPLTDRVRPRPPITDPLILLTFKHGN